MRDTQTPSMGMRDRTDIFSPNSVVKRAVTKLRTPIYGIRIFRNFFFNQPCTQNELAHKVDYELHTHLTPCRSYIHYRFNSKAKQGDTIQQLTPCHTHHTCVRMFVSHCIVPPASRARISCVPRTEQTQSAVSRIQCC